MCGRFTNRLTWREIVALYRLTAPATPERNLPARYNICPTTTIDAVIEREGKRELVPMRWGLIPSWWKKLPRKRHPHLMRVPRRSPRSRCFGPRSSAIDA
jgi:putative SOS response-associated peptidase YedK